MPSLSSKPRPQSLGSKRPGVRDHARQPRELDARGLGQGLRGNERRAQQLLRKRNEIVERAVEAGGRRAGQRWPAMPIGSSTACCRYSANGISARASSTRPSSSNPELEQIRLLPGGPDRCRALERQTGCMSKEMAHGRPGGLAGLVEVERALLRGHEGRQGGHRLRHRCPPKDRLASPCRPGPGPCDGRNRHVLGGPPSDRVNACISGDTTADMQIYPRASRATASRPGQRPRAQVRDRRPVHARCGGGVHAPRPRELDLVQHIDTVLHRWPATSWSRGPAGAHAVGARDRHARLPDWVATSSASSASCAST